MTTPPAVIQNDLARIPAELRAIPRWVAWRSELRDDKWTKVPIDPRTGGNASVSEPGTWGTFEEACARAESDGLAGVGFVLDGSGDFTGIDLDGCVTDGVLTPQAAELVKLLDTYAEYSPSGTGVRLVSRGPKPIERCRFQGLAGFRQVELYDKDRYITFTGRGLADSPTTIEDRRQVIADFIVPLCPGVPPPRGSGGAAPGFSGDDEELLAKARAAKNGGKFMALFAGDTSGHDGDDSRADLALCSQLAFWCGNDPSRIDRLFRGSGLYREKWEREDYRERTIAKAIEGCSEFYGGSPRRTSESGEALPEVMIDTDEYRVADEVVDAIAADPDIFQRGGCLVWVRRDTAPRDGTARTPGSATISVVPLPSLRERITKHCQLQRIVKGDVKDAHPPGWLVSAVFSRSQWPGVRELTAISETPVLRGDGTIWQTPGYDPVTGVLYGPSGNFPYIPENPDADDAWHAVETLAEIVADVDFESDAHRAAWLVSVMTPFAVHAFAGPSPLFMIDANIRGAGKGLLARVTGLIVLGRDMSTSTYVHDAEEMRKRITACVIAGDQIALLDNIVGGFGNGSLDAALTSTRWRDRILGKSEAVDLPLRIVWYATGNNILLGADTYRRVVHIRLDVLNEHPEERSNFKHPDLPAWVLANRGRFVTAVLTILAAYIRAGMPDQGLPAFGSFEGWSSLVRSAIVWAGQPDPCSTRHQLAEMADTGREPLELVIEAFKIWDPDGEGVVIADMLAEVYPGDGIRPMTDRSQAMRVALEAVCPNGGRTPTARKLGTAMSHYRRRVVNGMFIDRNPKEKRARGQVWRLCVADTGKPWRSDDSGDSARSAA